MRLLLFLAIFSTARADFALKDGDTVAFLGDSITAARGYPKILEHYCLMRFPERKIKFVNAGVGGDTASGCLERLDRDVFDKGATVVTVAFGINDIGWGVKADGEHKQAYLDGIRTIISRCKEKGVRPFICSAAITNEAPETAEKGFLQKMTDEGLALAKSLGAGTIDVQRDMRTVQRSMLESNRTEPDETKHSRLHVKDGIHLEPLGELTMAYAVIKGLGAPELVSSVEIDAETAKATGEGCEVSEIVKNGDREISFTRLDEGLPLNRGPFSQLCYRWIPVPDTFNRYMLTVRKLPEGDYEIFADGRNVGKTEASALGRGLNIASMTGNAWYPGGPWDVQSCAVMELVESRDKNAVAMELLLRELPETGGELKEGFRKEAQGITNLQRATAKPRPYRFTIRPAAKP